MKALFAGSFDPFTLGHLDIVKKTLKEYDELIICISNNETKKVPLINDLRFFIIYAKAGVL